VISDSLVDEIQYIIFTSTTLIGSTGGGATRVNASHAQSERFFREVGLLIDFRLNFVSSTMDREHSKALGVDEGPH